ncbi:beta-ketoacyl synthase N-terminal-like domain-containing protein [Streptomyces sp. NPDC005890]|uniref:beta-ketoacyl synthase N-terminal-like domain-containing protein n=1 Tax=Streptomyces sp. NPDC005890 TaxID=3154568 RepID=UPI0033C224D8
MRRRRGIRSSGCCWRRRGRRWESAGLDRAALRGSRTGVFTGARYDDYVSRLASSPKEAPSTCSTGTRWASASASPACGRSATRCGTWPRRPGGSWSGRTATTRCCRCCTPSS